jgi:large subunit ribosomal protein L10
VGPDQLKPLLQGPTALTFVRGDAAAAAKAIADFARVTQLLPFKGGVMDGAALTPAEVGVIARLPSREVLYGQLVGLVASPIAGLARTLNALIGGLAVGLGAVLEKREAAGEVLEAPAGASAEDVVSSEEPVDADTSGVAASQDGTAVDDVLGDAGAAPAGASAEDVVAAEDALEADTSGVAASQDGTAADDVLGDAWAEQVDGVAEGSGATDAGDVAEPAAEAPVAEVDAPVDEAPVAEVEVPAEEASAQEPVAEAELETDDESAPAASGDDEEKE